MVVTPIQKCTLGRRKRSGVFLFGLSSDRFSRRNPFDRSGFANSRTPPDLERFRRLAPLNQLVKEATADAVRGAKIVDRLRFHLGSSRWKQKIPALTNQGRGRVSFSDHNTPRLVNIPSTNNGASRCTVRSRYGVEPFR
jgi:hypothetical protein